MARVADLTPDDERAVERLSFYILKEAYGAVTAVVETLDPAAARTLFERIESQIEETLRRIHEQKSEGPASSGIAMAIAETLVPILDESHRQSGQPTPKLMPSATITVGERSTTARPAMVLGRLSKTEAA